MHGRCPVTCEHSETCKVSSKQLIPSPPLPPLPRYCCMSSGASCMLFSASSQKVSTILSSLHPSHFFSVCPLNPPQMSTSVPWGRHRPSGIIPFPGLYNHLSPCHLSILFYVAPARMGPSHTVADCHVLWNLE